MQTHNTRPFHLGYLYIVFAAALWASSGSAAKYLFRSGITPFQLVQLRTTISALLLFLWLLASKRSLLNIMNKDRGYFLLIGSALAATQFTYLYSISKITVAAAILLQYQAPVLIAGYNLLLKRSKLSSITAIAVAGAVSGCYVMVGAYNLDILNMNRQGIIMGLASACSFALYTVKSEYGMRAYSPWTVVFFALLISAGIWNMAEPPLSAFAAHYSAVSWSWIFFIGIFGTILPFGLYNKGIKLIHSTHASITATLEPVIAGGISFVFLGETMDPLQVAGAGLVISSILLLQIHRVPS